MFLFEQNVTQKIFNDTIVLNHFSFMTNVPQQVSSSPFLSE